MSLRGVRGRPVRATAEPPAVTLLPVWDPDPAAAAEAWPQAAESVGIIAPAAARDVLLARYPAAHVLTDVAAAPPLDHLIWVAPEPREPLDVVGGQSAGVLEVFRTVKALLGAGYGRRPLGWTFVTLRAHAHHDGEAIDPTHAGVAGLAGSIAKEYPGWRVRVADVDAYDDPAFAAVLGLAADPDGNTRIRRGGTWFRQQLVPLDTVPVGTASVNGGFREGGVYVVVGGAGGLGRAITEHLVRRYRAQVVWLGRRPLDAAIEAAAAACGDPVPQYLRADATSVAELRQARAEVERRFGPVQGVIHSGLVFAGASLARMTEAELAGVLRGKVDVSAALMAAFGGPSLEVAIFLSSINSYLKAIKQADYAAACTFLDSFARTVERRYGCAARVVNLGYCFNNAGTSVVGPDVPLIRPDELTAAIELLCAGRAEQLTLMKLGPALNLRGITVGEGTAALPQAAPEPAAIHTARRELWGDPDDVARLRARAAELTALAL